MEEIIMCQMCGKYKATEFVKINVHGVDKVNYICKNCAKILQHKKDISDFFGENVIENFFEWSDEFVNKPTQRVCKCGTTEQEVLENYKFGCAECYKTFADIAQQYVDKLGGAPYANRNAEKIADKDNSSDKVASAVRETCESKCHCKTSELDSLREQLSQAVDAENYLLANELKSKIDQLSVKKTDK
ncbi:MAG: hypothetical protein RSD04_00515 [Clostridia bacterium]